MYPTLIAIAICAVLSGASGFWGAWTLQNHTIDKLKLEAKDAIISQQRYARAALERATNQVIVAQNKAAVRNAVVRADAGRADSSGSGLRLASADAVRASAADLEACARSLATHSVVLAESITAIREMASDADAWAVQAVALQEAWPGGTK